MIFVHDTEQRAAAEASKSQLQQRLSRTIVTQIEDAPTFWPAEDYQQYLRSAFLLSYVLTAI